MTSDGDCTKVALVDPDILAEQLYAALVSLVRERTGMGLLAALGDIRSQVPFDKAAPKTRIMFRELANNLTRVQTRR